MKKDIILAGVGGQGILSIATVIGAAALEQGLYLKQAEVHGMSQRGGDVQSNLRLSSAPIHSDLIPKGGADLIVSLEPMEALRYLPYLSEEMTDIRAALDAAGQVIAMDVDEIAKSVLSPRSANMVLLGATAAVLDILDPDKLRNGIRKVFARKGEAIVETNVKAFDAGYASALNNR